MGAAYATLAYGEFLRRGLNTTYTLGGLYTSGGPRVCEQPFAQEVLKLTTNAKATAFRIVNHEDPIPTVPPPFPPLAIFDDYPYIHIDGAWKIFPDAPPEQMASEQPHNPVAPYETLNWNAHGMWARLSYTPTDPYIRFETPPSTMKAGRTLLTQSNGGFATQIQGTRPRS